jgi:hypothetical protein
LHIITTLYATIKRISKNRRPPTPFGLAVFLFLPSSATRHLTGKELVMNSPCTHEPLSPAVQRCCEARNRMIELDRSSLDPNFNGIPDPPKTNDIREQFEFQTKALLYLADNDPSLAYRANMPQPTTREAIQEYIACVLHGIAIEAIDQACGPKLLYGAQVAVGVLPKPEKEKRTHTPTPLLQTSA